MFSWKRGCSEHDQGQMQHAPVWNRQHDGNVQRSVRNIVRTSGAEEDKEAAGDMRLV